MAHTVEKVWTTSNGLIAAIIKHTPTYEGSIMNFRCGYVAVTKEHKLYEKEYNDVQYVDVHGGLTYSGLGNYPAGEEHEDKWFFGYDCGHYQDDLDKCTLEYCIAQCESLAIQLMQTTPPDEQS